MNPKQHLVIPALIAIVACAFWIQHRPAPRKYCLIPIPAHVDTTFGLFTLDTNVVVVTDEEFREVAGNLVKTLARSTGVLHPVMTSATGLEGATNAIRLLHPKPGALRSTNHEAYLLSVNAQAVTLNALHSAGMLHAVRTMLQLLPPEVFGSTLATGQAWKIPRVTIRDEPMFAWRGLMLDVARHYFTADELRKIVDGLALHKMNRLHLHLTDDQGWRLEISRYPRLAEVGAWRSEIGFGLQPTASRTYGADGRYGGFYSRDDVRELVRYAAEQHITLVPEIEMPGHASAALAAYPDLGCPGSQHNTELGAGVFSGIFCAGNEDTFAFLETVLTEVMEMFPGNYIHVGGDEVPKRPWRDCPKCQARMRTEHLKDEEELQTWFINRIERFVSSKGRRMIGWSEILEPTLSTNAIVMDWIGGGAQAAANGHDVIMSPVKYAYFDYYQSTNRVTEPRAIGSHVPLERVYAFEIIPADLPADARRRILGGQANLWTEYIPNLPQAEYMIYPRLCAMAEALWSPPGRRNLGQFQKELTTHVKRLDALGINYRPLTP